jgi:hypothetical protein
MLGVIVENSFGSQHDESRGHVFERLSNADVKFYREANAYFNSYSPSLDMFFTRRFKNNQTIEFNVVGTLLNSSSKRYLYDDEILQIDNREKGQRQSIILEGVYSTDFENFAVKSGVRHVSSHTENDYINATINTTEMNVQNSYLFSQFTGKISKFSYDIGVGLRIYGVNNRLNTKSYTKSVVTANYMDFYLSAGYTHPQKNLIAEIIPLNERNSQITLIIN